MNIIERKLEELEKLEVYSPGEQVQSGMVDVLNLAFELIKPRLKPFFREAMEEVRRECETKP
jgi:hypothetical protein